MAASRASIAASRLLNLRTPASPALSRRHLLHPSAALSVQPAATILTQLPYLFHSENDSPDNSSIPRNLNFHVSSLPLNLQLPPGHPSMRIGAARKANTPEEVDDDLENDDDDFGDFDDEDDDVDMDDFSGSDFDGEDSDEDDDDRRPRRK